MIPFVICSLCSESATCNNPNKFCHNMIKCENYIRKDTAVNVEKYEKELSVESVKLMILDIKTRLERG